MEAEELRKELGTVKARIAEIDTERKEADKRLSTAKIERAGLGRQIEAERKKRQDLLADGLDAKGCNVKIADARRRDELLEDEAIGLQKKLDRLMEEWKKVYGRAAEIEKALFKEERLRPLVDQYNGLAGAIAGVLVDLEELLAMNPMLIPGGAGGGTQDSSGQQLPLFIHTLHLWGEPVTKPAFSIEAVQLKRRIATGDKEREQWAPGRNQ